MVVVILSLLQFIVASPAEASSGRMLWFATSSGWHHVYVSLLAAGPHVSVYAEPGTVSGHDARMIADAFSWRIYPTDTATFGSPLGMSTVSIALLPLGGITLGYFNEDDVALNRPGADVIHSNRANVLYIRTPATMPDATELADVGEVAAHELQHLIDFRIRVMQHGWAPEDPWLNEGLSVYAQFANHYFTERDVLKVQAAAAEPNWQLTNMDSGNASMVAHARAAYGRAGLFVSYMASRFGRSIARDLIATRQTGVSAVAHVLARHHTNMRTVFANWGVAFLLDQRGRYGYGSLDTAVSRSAHALAPPIAATDLAYGYSRSLDLTPWTQQYLTLSPGSGGTLAIKIRTSSAHIPAALVLQRPGSPGATQVRWLGTDYYTGNLVAHVSNFGIYYTRATLVLADAGTRSPITHVQVTASLSASTSSSRSSRPLPPAGSRDGHPNGHLSRPR